MRRRISCLISCNFARMRSARVFRLIWNLPARVLPQMKVKPRKLKVSGLPSPRRLRRSAAKRPAKLPKDRVPVAEGLRQLGEHRGNALRLVTGKQLAPQRATRFLFEIPRTPGKPHPRRTWR